VKFLKSRNSDPSDPVHEVSHDDAAIERPGAGRQAASGAVVVLLTALVSVGPLTTDLYLPSLPNMARAFATDAAKIQLTLSLYLFTFGAAQLMHGPLSDRFGRRPVLLCGLALYVGAGVACALATSIDVLIAWRVVQAFGACSATVIGRAIVRDLFEGASAVRAMAWIGAAVALGPVLGPLAGGYLEESFGWQAGFYLLAGFGAVLALLVGVTLGETNRHRGSQGRGVMGLVRGYSVLLGNRNYVGFVAGVACSFVGLFLFIADSSFVMADHLGLSPSAFGLGFGIVACGYMVGNLLSARLSRRITPLVMVRAGAGLCALSGAVAVSLALTGHDTVAAIVAPMVCYMIGFGLIMPNGIVGAIAPFPERAGAASALLGFSQMTLSAVCAWALSQISHGDQMPMLVVGA
jgi:DHA1 family bicyclomycin/chloramphenicol resistance-like MFS transporter